jgi:hypothetical protein
MNIFKILANGHGTVSETNVSAFLGYLLDPNANHSLGYEFLNLFLNTLDLEEDFKPSEFDFQIFYEQQFQESSLKKSETVDICLLCYQTKKEGNSKSEMLHFIKNTKTLHKVFLIENKINLGSITPHQVLNQFTAFKKQLEEELEDPIEDIYSIYVTPDHEKFDKEFDTISDVLKNKVHLKWNKKNEISIKSLLKILMKKENDFKIEPFNDYTKNTLKAFIQFIDSDFKSEKQEKKEIKRDIHSSTDSLFEEYPKLLDDDSKLIVVEFEKYLMNLNSKKITFRSSKTHPIAVFYEGKKIFGINRANKSIDYDIIFKSYKDLSKLEFDNDINSYPNKNGKLDGVRLKPKTNNFNEVIHLFEKVLKKLNT